VESSKFHCNKHNESDLERVVSKLAHDRLGTIGLTNESASAASS
jgi:hypothetical protein